MWGEIAHSLQSGNYYILGILVLAFFALIGIFERIIALGIIYNYNHKNFLNQLRKTIGAEDFDRARNYCQSTSKTSLPMIAKRAIDVHVADPDRVDSVLSEEALDFLPKIDSRIAALTTFATLIVLTGVLGTIDALWHAFHAIDILDTEQKRAIISHGVTQSLSPIAVGILVAMLIIVGQQFVKSMAIRLLDKIHLGIQVLHNLLVPKTFAYAAPAPAGAMNMGGQGTMGSAAVTNSESFDALDEADHHVVGSSGGASANLDDTAVEDIKDEEEII